MFSVVRRRKAVLPISERWASISAHEEQKMKQSGKLH